MSIAATIRNARKLDLAGAQPGASIVVHKAVKTLEEEHTLRMNLQRENNRVRRIAVQMEDYAADLLDQSLNVSNPAESAVLETQAGVTHAFAAAIRTALTPEGPAS